MYAITHRTSKSLKTGKVDETASIFFCTGKTYEIYETSTMDETVSGLFARRPVHPGVFPVELRCSGVPHVFHQVFHSFR